MGWEEAARALTASRSARELAAAGFAGDVTLALERDSSPVVPLLCSPTAGFEPLGC